VPKVAWRRALPVALAILVVAGGALALTSLLGSPSSASSTGTAGASLNTQETVTWLGMQLQTEPPGLAVIDTVQQGSRGDQAGLEPGDAITAINNQAINGVGDIRGALRGLKNGDRVAIQVSYGSSNFQVEATLAAPPSVHP
jgi:S1-C subfamily serine protease